MLNRRLERLQESDKIFAGKFDKLHNLLKKKPHISKQLAEDKEIMEVFAK